MLKFQFLILLISYKISFAQIFLNEIMSLNISTIADEDRDFGDWIELANGGAETVNLAGFSLSDDIHELNKWVFPQVSIESGQYIRK